jgi:hypothetical protein
MEGKPYTKPSKTPPNWPRKHQQHHDPKTHESSSSPEANPTSGIHRSDRSHTPVRPVTHTGQTGQAWAARDEQHTLVNSPKSKTRSPESLHGLVQDFGDSRNTSWGVHSQVIVHQTRQIKRNRRNPAKNSPNPRAPKTPKLSPLTHRFGRGIKGKRTAKGSNYFPIKSPRVRSRKHPKKSTKRVLRKSPPKTNGNNTTKPWGTTPNHIYIPKRFIQGLACRLIIQPSHKISPWSSQASPMEIIRNKEGK